MSLMPGRLAGKLAKANPLSRRMAKRLTAGSETEGALEQAARLTGEGFHVLLHYLPDPGGEPEEQVGGHFGALAEGMNGLAAEGLDVYVSASLSQMGGMLSDEALERNAARLGEHLVDRTNASARSSKKPEEEHHCLMLETEDYDSVERTVALRSRLARHGVPAGITLQANLHRSIDDLRAQIAERASIRLVRGGHPQKKEELGMSDHDEITGNFLYLAGILFSEDAILEGIYPVIATHQASLIEEIESLTSRGGWPAGGYEFQFYLGLESGLQKSLLDAGHRVRVQIPFGPGWWPYVNHILATHPKSVYRG